MSTPRNSSILKMLAKQTGKNESKEAEKQLLIENKENRDLINLCLKRPSLVRSASTDYFSKMARDIQEGRGAYNSPLTSFSLNTQHQDDSMEELVLEPTGLLIKPRSQ